MWLSWGEIVTSKRRLKTKTARGKKKAGKPTKNFSEETVTRGDRFNWGGDKPKNEKGRKGLPKQGKGGFLLAAGGKGEVVGNHEVRIKKKKKARGLEILTNGVMRLGGPVQRRCGITGNRMGSVRRALSAKEKQGKINSCTLRKKRPQRGTTAIGGRQAVKKEKNERKLARWWERGGGGGGGQTN